MKAQITFCTWPFSTSMPMSGMRGSCAPPVVLAMQVRRLAPWSCSALIRLNGTPGMPKPLNATTAPSGMSRTASAKPATCLLGRAMSPLAVLAAAMNRQGRQGVKAVPGRGTPASEQSGERGQRSQSAGLLSLRGAKRRSNPHPEYPPRGGLLRYARNDSRDRVGSLLHPIALGAALRGARLNRARVLRVAFTASGRRGRTIRGNVICNGRGIAIARAGFCCRRDRGQLGPFRARDGLSAMALARRCWRRSRCAAFASSGRPTC